MIPYIVLSDNKKTREGFLKDFQKRHNIESSSLHRLEPLKKEFGIGEIKELKKDLAYSSNKPQLFVLFDFDKSSFEAQNAFLKTLEEHSVKIYIILMVSHIYSLLPTIISRCHVVKLDIDASEKRGEDIIALALQRLIDKKAEGIFSHREFDVAKGDENIFLQFLIFFKKRLVSDEKAPDILRKLITLEWHVRKNNVSAQGAIDHLLIFMSKLYKA